MEDAAQAAAALGLHDVAAAIRAAFVDDVSTSLDDMEKLNQLKTCSPLQGQNQTHPSHPQTAFLWEDWIGSRKQILPSHTYLLYTKERKLKADLGLEQNFSLTQSPRMTFQHSTKFSPHS